MFFARLVAVALAGSVTAAGALAGDGSATPYSADGSFLGTAPIPLNGFAFEATLFVDAPAVQLTKDDGVALYEGVYPDYTPLSTGRSADLLRDAEQVGLDQDQSAALIALRQAPSGDAALAGNSVLPPAVRLYTAGAIDFRAGRFDRAAKRFRAVLDLPPEQNRPRVVWAAYMLGRCATQLDDPTRAAAAFALTRALAAKALPDPLRLARASLGDEARLYVHAALRLGSLSTDQETKTFGREISHAMALYAGQAALGSQAGVASLAAVASKILSDPTWLRAVVGDHLVQRVLIAYSGVHEDAGLGHDAMSRFPKTTALIEAIEQRGFDPAPATDRLAVLAYDIGRYDVAASMAKRSDGPLASWVKARLAVRKDDFDAAAGYYDEATQGFSAADLQRAVDEPDRPTIGAESGIVALARGRYLEALQRLGRSDDWPGTADVAERVLTTDELKSFVDGRSVVVPRGYSQLAEIDDLLARRLMRDGRYDEALPYFTMGLREEADQYARALRAGEAATTPIARAKALYDASVIARKAGMDILGTELWPDYHFEFNVPSVLDTPIDPHHEPADQVERRAASAARPDLRYHYRYIAADLASRAADLLPRHSQAFAAVLCHATGWMIGTRNKQLGEAAGPRAAALYARYVKEGARIPFETHFGHGCPEPDFAAAGWFASAHQFDWLRNRVGKRKLLALAALAGLGGAAWILYRRRRFVS